ncbi:MAG: LuxR C-terminal-related transcriptional regulator [Planctomycetaceae bacterium]
MTEALLMTTAGDYSSEMNRGISNESPVSAPVFSMRTLMVTTPDLPVDEVAVAGTVAGAEELSVAGEVSGICSVCGIDRGGYQAWERRRDVARLIFERLSRREQEIAGLAAAGLSSRDCADRLGISVKTVEKHRLSAYRRLNVPGLAGLIRIFLEADLPVPAGVPVAAESAEDIA